MFYLNSVNLQEMFKISSGIQTIKFYSKVFQKGSGKMGKMGTEKDSVAKQLATEGGGQL